eukprot:GHUV01039945.1.p1 GENE.GHUV01039945.1~~GHUV01039945.1.p1  ORF type:complete len:208 (+),score=43.09 GHUV01039945.1:94-717(+)
MPRTLRDLNVYLRLRRGPGTAARVKVAIMNQTSPGQNYLGARGGLDFANTPEVYFNWLMPLGVLEDPGRGFLVDDQVMISMDLETAMQAASEQPPMRPTSIAESDSAQDPIDDDNDLIVANSAGVQKNDVCPVTLKLLTNLKEPVEDDKGFVYEGETIRHLLNRSGGSMECPVAGASHRLQLSELKPCRRVMRMQEQQQRQGAQTRA